MQPIITMMYIWKDHTNTSIKLNLVDHQFEICTRISASLFDEFLALLRHGVGGQAVVARLVEIVFSDN